MISYKSNPNLGLKVVTTASLQKEYRMNCRKIKDKYYIKNIDCFFINDTWYRVDSGLIEYDYEDSTWKLIKNSKMIKGIVDYIDNSIKIGFFTPNLLKNVNGIDCKNGNNYKIISEDVAKRFCIEYISDGNYYFNNNPDSIKSFSEIKNILVHKNKGYNIEDNEAEFLLKRKVFEDNQIDINKKVIKYSKLLDDLTFGAELETIRGYIPEHLQFQTGTIVCRDGSLHDDDGTQGAEFVTIPLKGAKGVQTLIDLSNHLKKRTIINHKCAFHLHLGNIPTSRVFLISLYKLAYMIQDDVFKMFPYYKNDEVTYAGKDKNYCKKLDRIFALNKFKFSKNNYDFFIKDNYSRIFKLLSDGKYPDSSFNRKNQRHPRPHKWERYGRYYWINFMNTIFSQRNTVEFRIHTATSNPQKIVTWLFICNSIIRTAIIKSNDILNNKQFTLNDCLDYYSTKGRVGEEFSNYLKSYVLFRTKFFDEKTKQNDFMVNSDIINDNVFSFPYGDITKMFYYE